MNPAARLIVRVVILLAAAIGALAVARDGLATRLLPGDPIRAAQLSPGNAEVAIAAAARRAGTNSGTRDPEVRYLVRTALARSVAAPSAIEFRALEAVTDGDQRRAARLFTLSDAISRRSLPTRLWLIQDAVDRGDVGGALANFDVALRTSTDAPTTLFPILAGATADPTLSTPLARLFDRPSEWRAAFFHYAIDDADAAEGLTRVVPRMRDKVWIAKAGFADALVGRLVADGDAATARRTFNLFHPPPLGDALLDDGDFADPGIAFPFGWLLVQKGEIGAERSVIHGRPALAYQSLQGDDGPVASQLLTLTPGRYRLSTRAAATATDPAAVPYWTIACADAGGRQVALLDVPATPKTAAAVAFVVPADCSAQWLVMTLRGSDAAGGQSGAVAVVAINRAWPG